jgi:hypothetical protein
MLMESLKGFSHKFDYAIIGHSGVASNFKIVDFGSPPVSEEDKVEVNIHLQHLMHLNGFVWKQFYDFPDSFPTYSSH